MSVIACQLESEGYIHLRGDQIGKFLQGQLSCDTRPLRSGRSIRGALCNVKGRVITDLRVIQLDDQHCLLRLRRSVEDLAAAILRKYAQFSRISVEVEPTPRIQGLRSALPGSAADLHPFDAPGDIDGVALEQGCLLICAEDGRWELFPIPGADIPVPVNTFEAGAENHYRAEALASGDYAVEIEDSEVFTPQQLNYDRTGRVSFDKGCYTGQEVIARLHYKGKSKRRLRVFRLIDTATPPPRDTPLCADNAREVGTVLRSEHDQDGGLVIAAQVIADETAPVYLASGAGRLMPVVPELRRASG